MNCETTNLEEYRCRKCGRLFYVDATQPRPFDRWAFFMEKGICEGNIDWDNIRKCARHAMRDEAMTHNATGKRAFDGRGRCLKCGSNVSFADVMDTAVFVGNEIVKQYPGNITNRSCVRCTYPKQYPEYEEYDGGSSTGANRHQRGAVQR